MTLTWWSLIRFVHVLAAIVWVGGQLTLSLVVLPVLRTDLAPEVRAPVIHKAARRYALIANVAVLPLSLITGIALAWHRGVTFGIFDDPGYGRLLSIKLLLVVASIVLAAAHGIVATRSPARARPLALSGLAASVGIVVFATALVP